MRNKSAAASLTITALLVAGGVAAQEWEYQTYGGAPRKVVGTGYLQLTESSPGEFKLKMMVPTRDDCLKTELPATVTEEAKERVITVVPRMAGCSEIRFVVKADGTGGKREVKQPDGSWKWDGLDHGLKRR